jgi:NAD(P)-dependent dehydrogenase (short-subunit alcohol dehydrogenase family)
MTDPFGLQNRTALVTGASRGIGARIATTLAGRSAHVLCAGRDTEALDRVVDVIHLSPLTCPTGPPSSNSPRKRVRSTYS